MFTKYLVNLKIDLDKHELFCKVGYTEIRGYRRKYMRYISDAKGRGSLRFVPSMSNKAYEQP